VAHEAHAGLGSSGGIGFCVRKLTIVGGTDLFYAIKDSRRLGFDKRQLGALGCREKTRSIWQQTLAACANSTESFIA
jgi:hypothetical protein